MGQDDDVPREYLPLSVMLRKQLQVYTGMLPAAMCVACCVRQLMRHKVRLFMQL